MVTKAVIAARLDNSNKYLVRIPVLESSGNSSELLSSNAPLHEAALSYTPGNINGYVQGDVVYISFENNDLSNVVIIGKLWLGSEEEVTNNLQAQTLKVNGSTELNGDVRVNGVLVSTMNENRQAIETLKDIAGTSQSDIEKNKQEIEKINKKLKFKDWIIEETDDNLNIYRLFNSEETD